MKNYKILPTRVLFVLICVLIQSISSQIHAIQGSAAGPLIRAVRLNTSGFIQRKPAAEVTCRSYYLDSKTILAQERAEKKEQIFAEVSGKTKEIEQFSQYENLGLWALVLGSDRVDQVLKSERHPVELLTEKEVKIYSKAWRTLRDISNDQFSLSSDLLMDVNKLLKGDVQTSLIQDLNPKLAFENSEVSKFEIFKNKMLDQIKKYFSFGKGFRSKSKTIDYSKEVLTEIEFANIKRNILSLNGNIEETSYSAENARALLASLPAGESVKAQLDNLLLNANKSLNEKNLKSFSEKVDFVSELHLALISLEPFAKLNELTVQMVINRVLIQLGLDPAVNLSIDIKMSVEEVAEQYRNGISDYINYTIKTYEVLQEKDSREAYVEREGISLTGKAAGLRVQIYGKYAEKYPNAISIMRTKDRVTPLDGRMVQLGKEKRNFIFKDDGFLYEGVVPYTVRKVNGKLQLFPISDYAYKLLGLNGDYSGQKGVRRKITPEHQELLGTNLSAVEDLLNGSKHSADFEIVYDHQVLQANKTGSLFLYPWQLKSLDRAVKIQENPFENPYAVLIPSRGDPIESRKAGRTSFEQNYFKGNRGNKIGDLIGQYEQRDLEYNQLARQIKENRQIPELKKSLILQEILMSRRKLHTATKVILKPFLTRLSDLSRSELKTLRENAQFVQLEDYFTHFSKLRYETFDVAISKLGDDHVFVYRLQSGLKGTFLVFLSQVEERRHFLVRLLTLNGLLAPQIREIYTLIKNPPAKNNSSDPVGLSLQIKQKIAELARGNKIAEAIFTEGVLIFTKRSQDVQSMEEFESLFMNHALHAINRGSKLGVSTTADPTYLLSLKTFEQISKLEVEKGLIDLFKEFNKQEQDSTKAAKDWLTSLAEREAKKKLDVDYYNLGWIGAFSKDFSIPLDTVIEIVNKVKKNNDKFTKQDDGKIYVLKVPVGEIHANYASGYAAQFEDTTTKGYGPLKSLVMTSKVYKGDSKFGVNLAGLSPRSRELYDMMVNHLEPQADFTPYLTFSATSAKHTNILGSLTYEPNNKLYQQAIVDLKGLKYDMYSILKTRQVEAFKLVVEDVFNTVLRVAENTRDVETKKEILVALEFFLKNHAVQRGGDIVGKWALELWETVKNSQSGYSKLTKSKASTQVSYYQKLLNLDQLLASQSSHN